MNKLKPVLMIDEGFDLFHIRGRGVVVTYELPEPLRSGDMRAWAGNELVNLQGCLYEIRGVELYALSDDSYQSKIGLLVKGPLSGKDNGD